MSTERLAYTPAIRRPRLPQHFAVGANDGKMAFAAEPLQKQQWVDVPRQKCESTAFWGKSGTLRFFLALGQGRAYNGGQEHQ